MPLHLQQHKSYHPYSRDNVERVRRDEEEARVEALERRERARRAEAEARIELLRSRAGGRGAVAAEAAAAPDAPLEAAASASRHGKRKTVSTLHDEIGHAAPSSADHVNFWADEEKSASSSQNKRPRSSGRESLRSSSSSQPGPRDPSRRSGTSSSAMQGNADFEAEQRAEKKRFEDQVTMFLGKPAKELDPWYQNGDLKSGAERKKTQEQRLEEAYKDSLAKTSNDPLRTMSAFLAQRDVATRQQQQQQQQQQAAGSYLRASHTKSSPSSALQLGAREKAAQREATEQRRVDALLRARSSAASGRFRIDDTPTPYGGDAPYNDQFYRDDVLAAKSGRNEASDQRQDFHERPRIDDPGEKALAQLGESTSDALEAEMIAKAGDKMREGSTIHNTEDIMSDDIDDKEGKSFTTAPTQKSVLGADRPNVNPLQSIDANVISHLKEESPTKSSDSLDSNTTSDSRGSNARPRESMYPVLLGEMMETVLENEAYLFSEPEQLLLRSFFKHDYEARHLLARLIQRRSTWHRVDKLNYDFDVQDKETAVAKLCQPLSPAVDGRGITSKAARADEELLRYCHSEREMEGGDEEALNLLNLDELKTLAKRMNRLRGLTTKGAIISALLTTKSQGTLHSFARTSLQVSSGGTSPQKAQSAVLRAQLIEIMGGCVRVNPAAQQLIDRVALVYYRCAEMGGSALTTAVLSRSRKRRYPDYGWQRSKNIFASRQQLLDMQRALALEVQMDQWIEWEGTPDAIRKSLDAFKGIYDEWKAAVCEGEEVLHNSSKAFELTTYNRMRFHPGWPLTRIIYKGAYILGRLHRHEQEGEVLRRLLAQRVFRRGRRGDWYDRLALITAQYPPSNEPHVVRKAKRAALAISVQGIEDPDTHLIYHDTLQRRITRLESQLKLPFSEKHDFSYSKLRKCQDRIFRGTRLDTMQGEVKGIFGTPIPSSTLGGKPAKGRNSGGSASSGDLSVDGELFATRKPLRKVVKVETMSGGSIAEKTKAASPEKDAEAVDAASPNTSTDAPTYSVERRDVRKDMHSVWRGSDGQPCRVETLVLQHYALEDYKGFHCEGGVLTMLFALVMWDIIYMPIEGVFETPYQRQPLDLAEDSFSVVRGPEIRQRLLEIEATGGLHLIRQTDDRERERKTWAVGCRWQDYAQDDLLEIAECMGGHALSVVCQMLSEEWGHCTAGMPDLVVWRYSDKQVRFCEVKGPGDKLSDKQKLWIDVLLRAGLHVEVSKVVEEG